MREVVEAFLGVGDEEVHRASPKMAKALEANTRMGSLETARIAGTESTAKMMSVISTTNSAQRSRGALAVDPG